MSTSTETTARDELPASTQGRLRAWPLLAALAGVLGFVATLGTDSRAGEPDNYSYTVSAADMADLGHVPFRVGGFVGYLAVVALIVFAAVWRRRVEQRFADSVGAVMVTFGMVAAAATLTFAYGWKGALGNYLHGAMEEKTYDDQGLYMHYILVDFGPYLAWLPALVALGGLAWMAFAERLVSRVLGGVMAFFFVGTLAAVGLSGVPGLPVSACLGLTIAGVWLALGRGSAVTGEVLR